MLGVPSNDVRPICELELAAAEMQFKIATSAARWSAISELNDMLRSFRMIVLKALPVP